MKVKQLIRELKKMPQNLEVDMAMHDNAEHESAGHVSWVMHFVKSDYEELELSKVDLRCLNDMSDECVIIRC